MKKIKVKSEKKIVAKEFKPIDFLRENKKKIINYSTTVIIIILCVLAFWVWQENKKTNALTVIIQAKDLYNSGKYDASLRMYKQFIKGFPRHKLIPAALLGVGYCYEELGKINEAKGAFLEIQSRYSDSPWTKDAVDGVERLG